MYSLVLDEIYLMQVYGKPELKGKVVVDLGAAVCDTSLFFCRQGANHVYAFRWMKRGAAWLMKTSQ